MRDLLARRRVRTPSQLQGLTRPLHSGSCRLRIPKHLPTNWLVLSVNHCLFPERGGELERDRLVLMKVLQKGVGAKGSFLKNW